jgi:hypothetical protein
MDLWHALMLSVAQSAHQGYDIQTEFTLGQRESSFLLRSVRLMVELAIRVHAAADNQPEPYQPLQSSDGSGTMVGDPQLLAALLAVLLERLEPDLEGGFGAGLVSGHGHLQSEDFAYQLTWLPALVQESFAVLVFGTRPIALRRLRKESLAEKVTEARGRYLWSTIFTATSGTWEF